MDSRKILLFNIVTTLIILMTGFLYFSPGLAPLSYTWSYFSTIAGALVTLVLLMFVNSLITLSYTLSRALVKKNLLRISLIILIFMFGFNFWGRISELMYYGVPCWQCWINTLLYLVLMLKDLYALINRLFSYRR